MKSNIRYTTHYFLFFTFILLITSCGSGEINDLTNSNEKDPPIVDDSGNYAGAVVIDLLEGSPRISKQENGRTNVVLQFIPRDNKGFSLTPAQVEIEFKIDGKPIGVESYLQSSASELQFNVNFGLVLDTSYSMVDRQALEPMLSAAKESVQSGIDIWANKESSFTFYTSWFNDYIYSANNTINTSWTPENISEIPAPTSGVGGATKLYSAIDYMVTKFNAIPTKSSRDDLPDDQNIILVFTDGEDTFSYYDNSDIELETLYTDSGAEFTKFGYKAVTSTDITEKLKTSENLTVHVIGLGDTIGEKILPEIAESGNGTFQNNPNTDELKSVFDSVVQEFTTLQTHGASLTIPPGNYDFTLKVKNRSGNLFSEYTFNFDTDNESAKIN